MTKASARPYREARRPPRLGHRHQLRSALPGTLPNTSTLAPGVSADVYSNCMYHAISEERKAVIGINSKINFYFFLLQNQ